MSYQLTTAKVWDGTEWVSATGAATSASGGTEVTSGVYKYHTFTSSSTFTMNNDGTVEYLIIAGGGAGGGAAGREAGGGGGAGELLIGAATLTAGSYAVTVGAGGAPTLNQDGADGGDSSVASIGTADGGGGGGGADPGKDGRDGGSGGGAWGNDASQTNRVGGNTTTPLVVNAIVPGGTPDVGTGGSNGAEGGSIDSNGGVGGRGGGKTTPGIRRGFGIDLTDWGVATSTGDSRSDVGTAVYYAGGGGGSSGRPGVQDTSQPFGGGGVPTYYDQNIPGNDGLDTSGGGGSGGTRGNLAGNGGDGVVILRYFA